MGLFGGKKKPKVTMAYAPGGPSVVLVSTPHGPTPLQKIIDWGWESIAALARWGYLQYGRGAVAFKSTTGEMTYIPADQIYGKFDPREVRNVCARYDPNLALMSSDGLAPVDLAPYPYPAITGEGKM